MMYSDESNSKKSSGKTLKEFLYSLYPDEDSEKTQAYNIPFQFMQDILVKSVLSPGFEILFRILFYIALDFFIVFSTPTLPWFEDFFPDKEVLTFSYISAKITFQVVSLLIVFITVNIIMMQFIFFVTYDPFKHLSKKSATFLHISFYYLPPIQSLFLGFIFGCLLVLNSFGELCNIYCTFLSLLIALVFLLVIIAHYFYCIFTRYSMLIRKGLFSTWEPPYSIISLLIFFLISAAFPFVASSLRKNCTLFCIATLIWSLSMIYSRQKPVYLSSIAFFVESKVTFDGVFYPTLLLINIWVNIKFQYVTMIMQILFILSLFISAIMTSSPYSFLLSSVREDGSINQENFTNSNACIMGIRVGLYYSLTNFFQNIDFLKWMVSNRFSSDMIPDIVRLNFVLNKDLNDFQIPAASFSPLELISLKFLAFQVRQYEKFILSSPEHHSISRAIKEMQQLIQVVDNLSKVFWTNRDYEQLTISQYGKKIYRISNFMKNLAISYPHSIEIQNLWLEYSKSIIQQPSKTVIKHVHEFTYIESPGNTIYHFLNQALPEDFEKRNQKRIDSTTEHFVSTHVDAAFNPIRRFYFIVPFIIFIIGIVFASLFALRSNKVFNLFVDNIKILTLSISLCLDSLNHADYLIQYPSISFISKTLHISLDAASLFRNGIHIYEPTYDKLTNFMGLFDQYEIDINIPSCPRFTLGFMIIFEFDDENYHNNENAHKCHLLWAAAYSRKLSEIAELNINEFYSFVSSNLLSNLKISYDGLQGIFILIFNVIFIIVFIIIILKQRKIIKKLILSIENIVAMNNDICERGELYVGFSPFVYLIIIILIVAVLSLYFIIYIFQIRSTEDRMIKLANQTLLVGNVCRFSTLVMASSIIEVGIKQYLDLGASNDLFDKKNASILLDSFSSDDISRLTQYINEIGEVRKIFARNLIKAANQLTLSDMDDIIKKATNWNHEFDQVRLSQDSKNSLSVNQTFRTCKYVDRDSDIIEFTSKKKKLKNYYILDENVKFENISELNYLTTIPSQLINQKRIVYTNNSKFYKNMKKLDVFDEILYETYSSSNPLDLIADCEYEFTSEIDYEAATMTSLSSIVIDFAQLLERDNLTVDDFNFLMAQLMYLINISSLLMNTFPDIASLHPIIFEYVDENYWAYFVLVTLLLIIVVHLLYIQIKCQQNWFFGISVLIRRAMAKYPERFLFIVGAILEDKPKYFDVLPIPIVILNKKGTILYANQVVMQYTKHTMDQTIGQPTTEFFSDNKTKYTDLTFSTEKRSFVNLCEKSKKKKKKNKVVALNNNKSEDESDSVDSLDNNDKGDDKIEVESDDCFDFIILRDTSKCMELQETFNELKERVTPCIGQIPSRGRLIFIECRFQTELVKPDSVFSKIDAVVSKYSTIKSSKKLDKIKKFFSQSKKKETKSIELEDELSNANDRKCKNRKINNNDDDNSEEEEEEVNSNNEDDDPKLDSLDFFDFKNDDGQLNDRCVTIISCGSSYLTAIARIGCEEEAIRFVLDLSSGIFMNFRASITEGFGTVFGIYEGDSIVVVAGDVSKRAIEANLFGLWGRIYIDYTIIERSGIEKELQNDELNKPEKKSENDSNTKNNLSQNNFNINKYLNQNNNINQNINLNVNKNLNQNNNLIPPQRFPGLESNLAAGPPGPKISPQPATPQAGNFGLAKFGLGLGLKKPAAPALNLKKSLIISISPLSKI